ncbi:MAG: hypothetical protein EOO66_22735 [Methylobacterium sp.]|nr:MAG: hypothetical protein EOO66_22735 [Methylobacterium sp.]
MRTGGAGDKLAGRDPRRTPVDRDRHAARPGPDRRRRRVPDPRRPRRPRCRPARGVRLARRLRAARAGGRR